ncbi:MAG: hypothetical protein P1U68_07450 [Verrucomicrobiales bacterium]|nr:hypothetical protein [Verrucomicrobiales bacterium]
MRYSVILTILFSLALTSAEAQVKRGGLFGFGSKDDQISSDLFPAEEASGSSEEIFRSGEPGEIDAVSYVIENGEKVEQKVESRKKGFLSFGRKAEKKVDDTIDAIPAVPAPPSSYPDSTAAPVFAAPETPAIVETTAPQTSAVIMEAVNAPVEEPEKKSGGLFSFFGKKDDDIPETPTFATPGGETAVVEAAPTVATANPYEAPENAAPTTTSTAPVAADPVPQFASAEPPGKPEKDGFSIPNPISKIRNQKEEKTIDLTGAETIIQNGEIVAEAEDLVESNKVETLSSGERQPPRIVNGVKTYSSWDDVGARSVSAADKILNQIR